MELRKIITPEYEASEHFENIFHIRDRCYPVELFVTLIVGEKLAALIDTGCGISDLKSFIRSLTNKPLLVFNTHGHFDHTGGNYQFTEVYQSSADKDIFDECLSKHEFRRALMGKCSLKAFDGEGYLQYSGENILSLEDYSVFELGGMSLSVIPSGVHSPGSVCFHIPEKKLLITGDSFSVFTYLLHPAPDIKGRFIKCLEHLSSLGAVWYLSSHNGALLSNQELKTVFRCAKGLKSGNGIPFTDPVCISYCGELEDIEEDGVLAMILYDPDYL